MTTSTTTQGQSSVLLNERRASLVAAMGAALLGVLILFGVGFAHPTVMHNAAHDARHAAGFPCH